jgi:hypothetical protein
MTAEPREPDDGDDVVTARLRRTFGDAADELAEHVRRIVDAAPPPDEATLTWLSDMLTIDPDEARRGAA